MAIWFTSDTHYGHKNIIKYCGRPFQYVTDMDVQMISNWNAKVAADDIVYFLGDFIFYKSEEAILSILLQLNGKIFFIRGNHDHKKVINILQKTPNVIDIRDLYELKVEDDDVAYGKQFITLCHYPLLTWNRCHHGAWHLHGHCHGSLTLDSHVSRMDVGVDTNDMHIYSYDDIKKFMEDKVPPSIDHHVVGSR